MDWTIAIQAIIPAVTAALVYGLRLVVDKIPRFLIPIIAMGLGVGLDFLLTYITGHTFSPLVAALLGAAATWLREIINTLQEHGASA